MKRVLIISHFEICYNPRLLKAGDYLKSEGFDVVLFNPLTGIADKNVYEGCIGKRNWEIHEADIRKHNVISYFRWLLSGLIFKIVRFIWKNFKSEIGHHYFFNKGLLFFPGRKIKNIDIILIHVIDSLPYAVKLKKKYNAKLIFDSQEYFKGQYAAYPKYEHDWVCHFEKKYIHDVDILLATTNAMLNKIVGDYNLVIPSLRVRNVPMKQKELKLSSRLAEEPLKLVWHGMYIVPNSQRGVSIILKAISLCKNEVEFYLQGNIAAVQKQILNDILAELNIAEKVKLLPAANPDDIIESLVGYDLGMIGEQTTEENQILTSSNKLFEYINAGLGVIAPDIIGINETLDEINVGMKYPIGDYQKMAEIIDRLAQNRDILDVLKRNSLEAAASQLYWEADYKKVINLMNN